MISTYQMSRIELFVTITLLSASLHYFQELGAVSLDGYFHLWKAENNLCKVKQWHLQLYNCLSQLFYADENHSNSKIIPVMVFFVLLASVH